MLLNFSSHRQHLHKTFLCVCVWISSHCLHECPCAHTSDDKKMIMCIHDRFSRTWQQYMWRHVYTNCMGYSQNEKLHTHWIRMQFNNLCLWNVLTQTIFSLYVLYAPWWGRFHGRIVNDIHMKMKLFSENFCTSLILNWKWHHTF